MPIDLSSAIAAGVNSLASLAGMSGSAHYQRRNMREAARLQHEENVYWAEYNTPANQMARLKAAGLNPNLVYGNGANAQFQGSVSPSGAAPEFKATPGTDYISFANMVRQNENLKKQNDVLGEERRKTAAEATHQEMENEKFAAANPSILGQYEQQKAKLELDLKGSEIQKTTAEAMLNASKDCLVKVERDLKEKFGNEMLPLQIKRAEIENQNAQLVLDNLPAQLKATLNLTRAQAAQATAQIGVLNAQSRYLIQQIENLKSVKDLTERQKRTEEIKQTCLGLDAISKELSNTLKSKTLPADVINHYMSPANLAVQMASGYGMPLGRMINILGNTSSQQYAPSEQSVGSGLNEPNYPWYY